MSEQDFEYIDSEMDELVQKKFRDKKLERKVIAYLLRRSHHAKSGLKRNFFTIEPYSEIFEIVTKKRMTFPKDILLKEVKKIVDEEKYDTYKSFVNKIYKEDLSHVGRNNIDKLAEDLKELWEARNLFTGIKEVLVSANDPKNFTVGKAKDTIKKYVYKDIYNKRLKGDYLSDAESRIQEVQHRKNNPKIFSGIPTGFPIFDKISGGGIQKGEFGIIVGKTGKGKSIMLSNLALNAWKKNYNVMFISLEMTKSQIQYRMDSRVTKIEHSKFRSADISESEIKRWADKMNDLKSRKKNFLEIVCMPKGCCCLDIEEEAMKTQEKTGKKVDLIVADYLNLLNTNKSSMNKKDWHSQSEVGWDIKALSADFNDGEGVGFWTANQLTDEGAKAKKIDTTHVKYSRGIAEVAPIIWAISQNEEEEFHDEMKLWIIKARDFLNLRKPIILFPDFERMTIRQHVSGIRSL